MPVLSTAKPQVWLVSRRNAFALFVLGLIAACGLFLQQSGRMNELVELALNPPPPAARVRMPDFIINVVDERGEPVPAPQVQFRTPWGGE